MSEVTRDEFNGLGHRVNNMSTDLAETKTTTRRNEKDIQTLFTNFEKRSKEFSDKADKISRGVLFSSFVLVIGLIIKEFLVK